MLYTAVKYLKQVSFRLQKFKIKKDNGNTFLANCKCPYCESDTDNKKARGYFYNKGQILLYHCHNCNISQSFAKFIKDFDFNVYEQFHIEEFKDKKFVQGISVIDKPKKCVIPDIFSDLKSMNELGLSHPAFQYVVNRKIPDSILDDWFYTPKFFKWAEQHTTKFKGMPLNDHPRMIIPWYDSDKSLIGYQARTFGKETPKYYTVMLDKSRPKIYGLERLDTSKRIYCVEGPIDSLFIGNCVAVGDAALYRYESDIQEVTYIPDSENRNKNILDVYLKLLRLGKDVCIMPDTWKFKDINEAIQAGLTKEEIKSIIDSNTFNSLRLQMKLTEWRKL
jgi:hypothetical protein